VRPTHAIETAEKGYSRERVRTSRIAAKWRCFKLPRACLDHAMLRLLTCGEAAFSLILARRRIGNLETPERSGGVRRHQSSFAMHDTLGHTLSVPRHLRGRRKRQLTHGRDEWDRDAGQLTASVLTGSEHSSQGALYRGADGARWEGRPAEAAAPPCPCMYNSLTKSTIPPFSREWAGGVGALNQNPKLRRRASHGVRRGRPDGRGRPAGSCRHCVVCCCRFAWI
jgi:hypothetical protein